MPRTIGIDGSLNASIKKDFPSPVVLAISGDETQHLLWRLQDGELSPSLCADPSLYINLLIGTNNLGNAHHTPENTARGVLAVVRHILSATSGRLLVHALLPRGQSPRDTPSLGAGHSSA